MYKIWFLLQPLIQANIFGIKHSYIIKANKGIIWLIHRLANQLLKVKMAYIINTAFVYKHFWPFSHIKGFQSIRFYFIIQVNTISGQFIDVIIKRAYLLKFILWELVINNKECLARIYRRLIFVIALKCLTIILMEGYGLSYRFI